MAWFADLAGKAENLLNNLDEQTGAALRNQNIIKLKKQQEKNVSMRIDHTSTNTRRRSPTRSQVSGKPTPEKRSKSPVPFRNWIKNNNSYRPPDVINCETPRQRVSPVRQRHSPTKCTEKTNNWIREVNDDKDGCYKTYLNNRQRRLSLPAELEMLGDTQNMKLQINSLVDENITLKEDLKVINCKLSDVQSKLCSTEIELSIFKEKFYDLEASHKKLDLEKDALTSHVEQLKSRLKEIQLAKLKSSNTDKDDIQLIAGSKTFLVDQIKTLDQKVATKESINSKLESDLRHANLTITELQNHLNESRKECSKLENDWQSYKVRVKNMLSAKDTEIKSLREGLNLTEDTKILIEEMEILRHERDELNRTLSSMRIEHDTIKHKVDVLENQCSTAERTISVLRDTLKEEREYKNRLECRIITLSKEMNTLQIETNSEITKLRQENREKDDEIKRLMDSNFSIKSTDTSALNVGDYDSYDHLDNNKLQVQCLTETLVQKQARIDCLLADNNMLRIQLDKIENKLRNQLNQSSYKNNHSVVQLDHSCTAKAKPQRGSKQLQDSLFYRFSTLLEVFMRRYPLFRVFILVYMSILHFWVFTVLFTSTSEINTPSQSNVLKQAS